MYIYNFYILGFDRSALVQHIEACYNDLTGSISHHKCQLCGKTMLLKNNLLDHVESKHFPFSFVYHCNICDQQMRSKKALTMHIQKKHKEIKKEKEIKQEP